MYYILIISLSCMFYIICAVPSWDLLSSGGSEGETVDVCATLSGLPSNGLECDVILKLAIFSSIQPNLGKNQSVYINFTYDEHVCTLIILYRKRSL